MPTPATVAPHRVRTAEDVVAGLRAFADLIEAGAFPGITGALRADLHVTNRDSVEAAARVVDTDATDSGSGLLKAAASIAGVDLTVYTVDRSRLLHRDPEATATLAERDA